MISINNYNSTTRLTIEAIQLTPPCSCYAKKYIVENTTTANHIETDIVNYQVHNIALGSTAYVINPVLKASIIKDNADIFKKIIFTDKQYEKPTIYTLINTYTNIIINYRANNCLIELLVFLKQYHAQYILEKDSNICHYIFHNSQVKEIILKKHYFVLNCQGVNNLLSLAIDNNDKHEAIKTFKILFQRFRWPYIGKYHNPIVYAMEKNNFTIFKALISIAPKFFMTMVENNATPIMVAAQHKNSSFLEYLLQCDYANNAKSRWEQLKLSISDAIEFDRYSNIKILVNYAPLILFESLSGKSKTILALLFEKNPDYFAIALANTEIRSQVMNPIYFVDFSYEKHNPSYKLLVALQNPMPSSQLPIMDNKKLLLGNNKTPIVDALTDYKHRKKSFCLDHINADSFYIENLNLEMIRLVSSSLPNLRNLAIYIKTKQYYQSSSISNKVFSYGDENASITLIHWLIKLGATKIKVILSPPDSSTASSRKKLLTASLTDYHNKKIFCLKKLSHLFPAIEYNNTNPQTIIHSGCELNIGFVDNKKFMATALHQNNMVHIKNYQKDRKLLNYNGTIITFSASEIYKELVADNLIIIKPFAFAKRCEQMHTDVYIDKKNKSIYSNITSLANPPYGIIPEITNNIKLQHGSDNYTLQWLITTLTKTSNGHNIANIINLMQLYLQQNIVDHSAIYGIHHNNVKNNAHTIIKNWLAVLDRFRANRDVATVLSIFPNTLLLDIDLFTYNKDILFLSLSDANIIANFKLAVANKKMIIFTFPALPKQVFQFFISNSNLPMLTEGANTTSFLLQQGMPYLSLLPSYTTKVPCNIGDPLQSFLIEALSYKLFINENTLLHLANLYDLVKQKKFTEAKAMLDNCISQHNSEPSGLLYLWYNSEDVNDLIKTTKITAYQLITTGNKLSIKAYGILLQALSSELNSITTYIRKLLTKDTPEQNHLAIIKHNLHNNFNNAVVTSLYKFFKYKNIT